MNKRQQKIDEIQRRWQIGSAGCLVPYSAMTEGKEDIKWLLEENKNTHAALEAVVAWLTRENNSANGNLSCALCDACANHHNQ